MVLDALMAMGVVLYMGAIIVSLILYRKPKWGMVTGLILIFIASILAGTASLASLITGSKTTLPLINNSLDPLSLLFINVVSWAGAAASIYGVSYMEMYRGVCNEALYSALLSLFILSMIYIVSTNNLLWFVFAWETMTLSSIVLIGWEYNSETVRKATVQYLYSMFLLNTLPLLTALFISWGATGFTSLDSLSGLAANPIIYYTVVLLLYTAFTAKAGLFPLHYWLPDAHPAAPSNVSALLSGVMIKMGVYGIIRILLMIMKAPWWLGIILLVQAFLSIYWGSLKASLENHGKRLLAYSSVSHIGYITAPLGLGVYYAGTGYIGPAILLLTGSLLYLYAHSLFKTLLFLSSGATLYLTGTINLDEVEGVAWRSRVFVSSIVIAAISITGLPPLLGFIAKLAVYGSTLSVIDPVSTITAILLLAASPLTILYIVKYTAPHLRLEEKETSRSLDSFIKTGLIIPIVFLLVFSIIIPYGLILNDTSRLLGAPWIKYEALFTPWIRVGGVAYSLPVLILAVFLLGILLSYTIDPLRITTGRIWTTGYLIPLKQHRIKPSNMYHELEEALKPLTSFLHEVYDCIVWRIPGRLGRNGIASRLVRFSGSFNKWLYRKLRGFTICYSKSFKPFKLDEAIGSYIVSLLRIVKAFAEYFIYTPIGLFTMGVVLLAILVFAILLILG